MSFREKVDGATADVDFDANKYQIELDTTQGKILLDLDPSVAPEHCRNMIGLARSGYYDNLSFHRVIEGFMIQGGCNRGDGTGGPGYMIRAEFNDTRHEPGVLSMARSSNPNSAGAQFFICLAAHSHLDGQYTAFGRTANAESLAVVNKIGALDTDYNDRPREPVIINTAKVIETSK
ncbi:MAG: peptidylprolyl isomerase [Planctomycetales bacterium]|nr:peptidylprolyl isomerase [Planctomycetales bacterium]